MSFWEARGETLIRRAPCLSPDPGQILISCQTVRPKVLLSERERQQMPSLLVYFFFWWVNIKWSFPQCTSWLLAGSSYMLQLESGSIWKEEKTLIWYLMVNMLIGALPFFEKLILIWNKSTLNYGVKCLCLNFNQCIKNWQDIWETSQILSHATIQPINFLCFIVRHVRNWALWALELAGWRHIQ